MVVRVRLQSLGRLLVRRTANLLVLAGALGVLIWVWALSDGALYQHVQEVEFASNAAPAPTGGGKSLVAPPGEDALPSLLPGLPHRNILRDILRDPRILGRLEIPNVHLTVMIRDGDDATTLRRAVGHLSSSALPGEAGNFVLLGHRDTFFRPLRDIAHGDAVTVRTRHGKFTYVVDSIQVLPAEAVTIARGPEAVATLITCYPFDFIGSAPKRFVVQARLAGSGKVDRLVHGEVTTDNRREERR
jgi:sortase A